MSLDPKNYVAGKQKMIDLPDFSDQDLATARHRTFEFGRSNGTDSKPWAMKTDGGQGLGMDPRRVSAAPVKNGDNEIWHIINGGETGPGEMLLTAQKIEDSNVIVEDISEMVDAVQEVFAGLESAGKDRRSDITEPSSGLTSKTFVVSPNRRGRLRFRAVCPIDSQRILSSDVGVRCFFRGRGSQDGLPIYCLGIKLDPKLEVSISCAN
jgi:hypothetical protein